ncbi:MAG: FliH/SctL family protein [Rhodoferax sp.]
MSNANAPTDSALERKPKLRPARVWQPTEILRHGGQHAGFQGDSLWVNRSSGFELQGYGPPKRASAATDATEPSAAPSASAPQEPMESTPPPLPLLPTPHDDAALAQARAAGYAQGAEETRLQMQAQFDAQQRCAADADYALVEALKNAIGGLAQDPQTLFEPLKRLSLHLAEQLLLAELQLDGAAIARLVQRCVDELSQSDAPLVRVDLNPLDLAQLQSLQQRSAVPLASSLSLHADAHLTPGSVRASANDALVEDLTHHRLAELAHDLLPNPARWQEHSTLDAGGGPDV